jgi:hypothetical protein
LVGVAVKVTLAPKQIEVWLAATETAGVTLALTVIVIGALLAVGVVLHVALDVITTVTTSPFVRVVEVKVGLFVPTFELLTLHWYEGAVPPFVGVAVNVTDVPAQMAPDGDAAMVTPGVTFALTVIVIGVLVAVGVVVQEALLVMITLTWSLFARVVVVNVAAVCPGTVVPFRCHS